jgi:hypothetical protein
MLPELHAEGGSRRLVPPPHRDAAFGWQEAGAQSVRGLLLSLCGWAGWFGKTL